ncbi:hypothetical protein COLO4_08706 [Corchorus olitorius]|uniref:Transmembrane protein n=1 Tax=Corchorus olitorius TaxID=93759 RepID=A0A1R3KEV6_9ROSI|nr:hypothetical protein COLO4_08706 [Corchorus olitorius]
MELCDKEGATTTKRVLRKESATAASFCPVNAIHRWIAMIPDVRIPAMIPAVGIPTLPQWCLGRGDFLRDGITAPQVALRSVSMATSDGVDEFAIKNCCRVGTKDVLSLVILRILVLPAALMVVNDLFNFDIYSEAPKCWISFDDDNIAPVLNDEGALILKNAKLSFHCRNASMVLDFCARIVIGFYGRIWWLASAVTLEVGTMATAPAVGSMAMAPAAIMATAPEVGTYVGLMSWRLLAFAVGAYAIARGTYVVAPAVGTYAVAAYGSRVGTYAVALGTYAAVGLMLVL